MRILFPLLVLAACKPGDPNLPDDDDDDDTVEPPLPTVPIDLDAVIAEVVATVHPTQASLLVVSWTQLADAEAHLEFSVDADVWASSPLRTLAAGLHEELVVGVPFDSDITWRLVATTTDGTTSTPDVVTRTGSPPQGLPQVNALIADATGWDAAGAPFLFTTLAVDDFEDPWTILIYDRAMRPVWAQKSAPEHITMHARVARDGASLFIDQNTFWSVFDLDGGFIEQITLDGAVVNTFAAPGLHHPFTDLPGGSVAYGALAAYFAAETLDVVEPDGTHSILWQSDLWMASIGINEDVKSNTLNYDEATDRFLFSFWSLESIVEIDGATGLATRWFGHVPGSYAFDPPESAFWWQHGGHVTPTGTLLTSTDLTPAGVETVVREYEIDDATLTLREVWSFGVGDGIYGYEMGEAGRLPNGNTWHNYGNIPRLREATPDGTVVWDVSWDADAIGKTMPIVDLYAMAGVRP